MRIISRSFGIDLDLQKKLTIIRDLSGVGKTLLQQRIINHNNDLIDQPGHKNIVHIYPGLSEESVFALVNTKWDLLLVDEYDVIVNYIPRLGELLHLFSDRYIIVVGRRLVGLRCQYGNFAKITANGGTIGVEYSR